MRAAWWAGFVLLSGPALAAEYVFGVEGTVISASWQTPPGPFTVVVGDPVRMNYRFDSGWTEDAPGFPCFDIWYYDGPKVMMTAEIGPVRVASIGGPGPNEYTIGYESSCDADEVDTVLVSTGTGRVIGGPPTDVFTMYLDLGEDADGVRSVYNFPFRAPDPATFLIPVGGVVFANPPGFVEFWVDRIFPMPWVTVRGQVGGPRTISGTGFSPSSNLAVVTGMPGAGTVPSGACLGVGIGLASPTLRAIVSTNPNGVFSLTATLPPTVSGQSLVLIDLTSCALAPAVVLP